MSEKSLLDLIQSPSPCSKNWDEMLGDELVRFCGGCEKNVYNLSAMTAREAHEFAAKNAGKVCIRYVREADGRVRTADAPLYKISGRAARLTAGVFGAALTLSVLAQAQAPTPTPKTDKQKTETKAKNKNPAKTSRISFTIVDPNGAVIPGPEVKLIDQKTKEEFSARADDEGVARFYAVPRGDYEIKIDSYQGFRPYRENVQIRQPVEPNIKITLDVSGTVVGVFLYDWSEIPLFRAIAQDDNEAVKQSIEAGFDVNAKDEAGQTALHAAVRYGNLEIVRFLIEKGAKVNIKDKSRRTALAMIFDASDIKEADGREIVRLLAAKGADLNVRDDEGSTLLMAAAEDDNLEGVKMLLELGADPNARDEDGETAFDKTDSEEIRRLLIRYGARKTVD